MNIETKNYADAGQATPTALASPRRGRGRLCQADASPTRSRRLFPQAPKLQPGLELFALLSASGVPILLTDNRDAAVANAWANDLQTVSLH